MLVVVKYPFGTIYGCFLREVFPKLNVSDKCFQVNAKCFASASVVFSPVLKRKRKKNIATF